jgi:hypothetical protein
MSLRIIALLALVASLIGCSKVNQENYDRLKTGMSKAEVEEVLGKPNHCDAAMGVSSCVWGDEQRAINVQYARDVVLTYSGRGLQ